MGISERRTQWRFGACLEGHNRICTLSTRDGEDFVMERLDRAFASVDWVNAYSGYSLRNLPIVRSGHGHILLDFDITQAFKHRPFRFERMWMTHPKCKEVVQTAWNFSVVGSRPTSESICYLVLLSNMIMKPSHNWMNKLEGSYYLVDSGYPIGASFLPPHKATLYHAQEFKRSNRQPALGKELFNYRHSSLRMVIERSFGVLKARFPILSCMTNYKESWQRLVVSVCCALHNFMHINNCRDEMFNSWENLDVNRDDVQVGNNGNSLESSASAERRHVREMFDVAKRAMGEFRDDVTARMWEEYTRRRG
ncbi:hypothetical protein SO802_005524 [Lithocarpus litseifolius]|uniref:DDE Tnp4 domain-containing protein n=1 Tax=Lithocarpus litseifolius TaxID=425828 RepID=A0AAW2DNZ6_9ROSI